MVCLYKMYNTWRVADIAPRIILCCISCLMLCFSLWVLCTKQSMMCAAKFKPLRLQTKSVFISIKHCFFQNKITIVKYNIMVSQYSTGASQFQLTKSSPNNVNCLFYTQTWHMVFFFVFFFRCCICPIKWLNLVINFISLLWPSVTYYITHM